MRSDPRVASLVLILPLALGWGCESEIRDSEGRAQKGGTAGMKGGEAGAIAQGGEAGDDIARGGTAGNDSAGGSAQPGSGGDANGGSGIGGATAGDGGEGALGGSDSGNGGSDAGGSGGSGDAGLGGTQSGGNAGSGETGGSSGTAGSGGARVLFADDFESGTTAWTTVVAGAATWSLATDGTTVFQTASAAQNSLLHAALAGDPFWRDVRVEARVKVISTAGIASDRFAGLCARFQDADNYHCVALRSTGETAIRSRVAASGSSTSPLGTYSTGNWYDLRIDAIGTTITAYVNGTFVGTLTTTVGSGQIALVSPGVNAAFDDVRVTEP